MQSCGVPSPDGRWITYQSDESGRNEIYVQSFPGTGGKYQVSTEGGFLAVWAHDMTELFYREGNKILGVNLTVRPSFSATKPVVVFEGPYAKWAFPDIDPDGRSFVMLQMWEATEVPKQMNIVLGSTELLQLGASGGK